MGKIYSAIEKSRQEKGVSPKPDHPAPNINIRVEEETSPDFAWTPPPNLQKVDDNLVTLLQPQSMASEQFKKLKTALLFPKSGKMPRTIMVTSATPGEGKSFVAANLALSIAQNINEYVLLMDCDLRNPHIPTMFGFSQATGLTDYLSNGTPLDSVLLKSVVEKLTILPSGNPPDNPAELLSSEKMSNLLKEVKSRYKDRYIIIDLPPPSFSAEANVLARQVDGILLVVKYGGAGREQVKDLVSVMGKEKILGVVFNRFDDRLSNHYKYKKYNKYYARSK